jgi:hypothetical protein
MIKASTGAGTGAKGSNDDGVGGVSWAWRMARATGVLAENGLAPVTISNQVTPRT